MKSIKIGKLTPEAFAPFGSFARLVNPEGEKFGDSPIEFYRDILQFHVSPETLFSYSAVKCSPRPLTINTLEFHNKTWEVNLPLDNDIILYVAPAVGGTVPPLEKMKAFLVPQGTMYALKAGVWHWAPFPMNDRPANVMVNLPERTYFNDCTEIALEEKDWIRIEL